MDKNEKMQEAAQMAERFKNHDPTCEEIHRLLNNYVDGELDEKAQKLFDLHFNMCTPCVDFLESYRAAIKLGKCAPTPEMPEVVRHTLRGFLREHGIPLKKK